MYVAIQRFIDKRVAVRGVQSSMNGYGKCPEICNSYTSAGRLICYSFRVFFTAAQFTVSRAICFGFEWVNLHSKFKIIVNLSIKNGIFKKKEKI